MHALKSPVNQTKVGDQTCEKSGCFYTRKPFLNCSFQNDDTQFFQNILEMCLLRPEQRNKLKNSKTYFSSAVKSYVKKALFIRGVTIYRYVSVSASCCNYRISSLINCESNYLIRPCSYLSANGTNV